MRLTSIAALAAWTLLSIVSIRVAADDRQVTVEGNESTFTLSNGIGTAQISKRSGDIRSLQYKGTEVLTDLSGHAGGYWSHDTTGGVELESKITIAPATNAI